MKCPGVSGDSSNNRPGYSNVKSWVVSNNIKSGLVTRIDPGLIKEKRDFKQK